MHRVLFVTLPLLAAPAAADGGEIMCTMEYRPVCGWKDGRWRTFSNSCQARAVKARRVRMGACRGRGRS